MLLKNAAEWWKANTEAVLNQAMKTGLPPNVSDAHTINGHPGSIPDCPSPGTDMGYIWFKFLA